MTGIQQDLSLDEMRSVSRRAEIDFCRELTFSPAVESEGEPGIEMWATPVNWQYVNGIYISRNAQESEDVLERAQTFFARNAIDRYMVWMDEGVNVSTWLPHLSRNGLVHDPGSPLLVLDMSSHRADDPIAPDLRIEQVGDAAGLDLWARTSAAGFDFSAEIAEGKAELWTSYGLKGPMEFFIGFEKETPVTTAAVHYTPEVADLVIISTIASARKKGYGGAITRAAALAGKARGYRYAVLSASSMGKPVYERLGFVVVGQLDNFAQPPQQG